ncbi:unnamed protein product [marine sediment metagenome]|uniref:Uncharacterized protein n=1 Tax=marine sediment metagenome TaxID=412755 RepID=X0SRB4_9ZZZZ
MPLRARGISLAVSNQDSVDNLTVIDVIGSKIDTHDGGSLRALAHKINDHTHGMGKVYPELAASFQVVSANAAHTLGVFKEIAAVNQITTQFDIHWISVLAASANAEYELVLYAGTTEISRCSFARTDKKDIASVPFQCEIQPANTQIQAKLSTDNAAGDTCNIKIMYHLY